MSKRSVHNTKRSVHRVVIYASAGDLEWFAQTKTGTRPNETTHTVRAFSEADVWVRLAETIANHLAEAY